MTSTTIPFNNLHAPYAAIKTEIDEAVHRVLDSGWYILGKEVTAFEDEFAAYTQTAGCVGVNSGTDALQLALMALGIFGLVASRRLTLAQDQCVAGG